MIVIVVIVIIMIVGKFEVVILKEIDILKEIIEIK